MVTTYSDHPPPSQGIDLDRRSAERENSVGVGSFMCKVCWMQDEEVLNAAEGLDQTITPVQVQP